MKEKMRMFFGMLLFVFMLAPAVNAQASGVNQSAQTKNTIDISWEAENNAIEYYISLGKDYNDVKTVTPVTVPANTTSYRFSNLQAGTAYYVKIEYKYKSSYSDKTYTGRVGSEEIKTLPDKVSGLNQTKWFYYIKYVDFAWNEQTGVDGFEYIVKDNKNKTIKKDSSRLNKSSVSKVSNSKVYNVVVRAYTEINGKTYYGDWSDKAYLFTQPMVKSAKISGSKLKITWNKVSGVTSYDVYVSTKEKSGYKKVKTVSSKKNSVTVSKLKSKKFSSKKKYYIYIVGKKKVGNKTYTSGRHYTYQLTKGKNGTLKWTFN